MSRSSELFQLFIWANIYIFILLFGVLAGIYDPFDYYGNIPPVICGILQGGGGFLCFLWAIDDAAAHKNISSNRLGIVFILTVASVPIILDLLGFRYEEIIYMLYFIVLGAMSAAIYPKLAFGSLLFGALVGAIDGLIEYKQLVCNETGLYVIKASIGFALFFPFIWAARNKVKGYSKKG